jgi:EAL domain-containing protein (putative c-di-GMP-specific phosphodiesterase class I)
MEAGHRLSVAVNVSYMQFVRSDLLQVVRSVLAESGLPAQLLELELTESILIADPESVLGVVRQLRDLGVTLSIDDFGTGYSSLSYLKRFSVHKLKIDRSFIRDILTNSDDSVIVAAVINLANNLQIECIAEGVESEQQALRLGEMGCQQIQGYWLARPLSVPNLDALLVESQQR